MSKNSCCVGGLEHGKMRSKTAAVIDCLRRRRTTAAIEEQRRRDQIEYQTEA